MMASGLLAAAALVAPASAAAVEDSRTGRGPAGPRGSSQGDLYAPAPRGSGAAGTTGRFLEGYRQSLSASELERGTRLGPLALAPASPPTADRRAGVGVTGRWSRLPLVAGVLGLLAAAAFLLASPSKARAGLPGGFVGIATEDVYTGDAAYASLMLGRQRRAGFTIARQVFRWAEIEPADGQYDFSATDRFVLRAAQHRIRVLPLLFGEPAWATSRPPGNVDRAAFPPRDFALFARFGAALAQRYGPGGTLWAQHPGVAALPITSYQLWNEPNFPLYWGGRPDAAAYARLLVAGAGGIRRVQPGAYIVSGGIPDSRLGQNPRRFAKAMLRAGARGSVDAIGIHPYAGTVREVVKNTAEMRRAVDTAGGRHLALWATEFGWAAGGPWTKERTVKSHRQGEMITDAFEALAKRRRAYKLRGVVYFAWRDSEVYAGGRDFWGLFTGLVDRSGQPKPALRRVTKVLPKLK